MSVEGMISSSLRQEERERAKIPTQRSRRVMDEVFIAREVVIEYSRS